MHVSLASPRTRFGAADSQIAMSQGRGRGAPTNCPTHHTPARAHHAVHIPRHAVVIELAEDLNLLLNIVDFVLGALEVDDLDRYRDTCAPVVPARQALCNVSYGIARAPAHPLNTSPKEPLPVMVSWAAKHVTGHYGQDGPCRGYCAATAAVAAPARDVGIAASTPSPAASLPVTADCHHRPLLLREVTAHQERWRSRGRVGGLARLLQAWNKQMQAAIVLLGRAAFL